MPNISAIGPQNIIHSRLDERISENQSRISELSGHFLGRLRHREEIGALQREIHLIIDEKKGLAERVFDRCVTTPGKHCAYVSSGKAEREQRVAELSNRFLGGWRFRGEIAELKKEVSLLNAIGIDGLFGKWGLSDSGFEEALSGVDPIPEEDYLRLCGELDRARALVDRLEGSGLWERVSHGVARIFSPFLQSSPPRDMAKRLHYRSIETMRAKLAEKTPVAGEFQKVLDENRGVKFKGIFEGNPGDPSEVGKALVKQTLKPDVRIGARVKSLELKEIEWDKGNYQYKGSVDQFLEVFRDGGWVQATPSKPSPFAIDWNLFNQQCTAA
ncbi:MAG: hypothetical protein KDK48_03530 [Chlamydiia bacterium]|nr:hypothetical protein [Chlamydiia bacterium]